MPMNKVVHAAQRAAFSAAIDVTINAVRGKGTEKLSENAVKLVNLAEPLLKDRYPASAFDAARKFVSDPNGKWMQYAYRAINEIDPHVLKMNALNLVYEGMFSGYNYVCELRKKYDCNMPWILLFDPTSACNLHCKGCWAAEYGNRLNLTWASAGICAPAASRCAARTICSSWLPSTRAPCSTCSPMVL